MYAHIFDPRLFNFLKWIKFLVDLILRFSSSWKVFRGFKGDTNKFSNFICIDFAWIQFHVLFAKTANTSKGKCV